MRTEAPPLRAVLFDLDGTLLDTAPDMAAALNRLRSESLLPPLPYGPVRPLVSHGSARLHRSFCSVPQMPPGKNSTQQMNVTPMIKSQCSL